MPFLHKSALQTIIRNFTNIVFFQKRFVAAPSDFQQVGKFVNFRFALLVIRNTKRQEFCKITVVIGIPKMCKAMRNNIFL